MFQAYPVFTLPGSGIDHFCKEFWFFCEQCRLETKIWVLSVLIANGVSLLLGHLMSQRWEIKV